MAPETSMAPPIPAVLTDGGRFLKSTRPVKPSSTHLLIQPGRTESPSRRGRRRGRKHLRHDVSRRQDCQLRRSLQNYTVKTSKRNPDLARSKRPAAPSLRVLCARVGDERLWGG